MPQGRTQTDSRCRTFRMTQRIKAFAKAMRGGEETVRTHIKWRRSASPLKIGDSPGRSSIGTSRGSVLRPTQETLSSIPLTECQSESGSIGAEDPDRSLGCASMRFGRPSSPGSTSENSCQRRQLGTGRRALRLHNRRPLLDTNADPKKKCVNLGWFRG
jgi:hypothetical protein